MKFIVDAQLPKSLSDFLKSKGFDSIHTLDLPDKNETKDYQINNIALVESRIVITKDTDFLETFLLKSIPQKLILIKTGNTTNKLLLEIFDNNLHLIVDMITRSNFIEVSKSDFAEHE